MIVPEPYSIDFGRDMSLSIRMRTTVSQGRGASSSTAGRGGDLVVVLLLIGGAGRRGVVVLVAPSSAAGSSFARARRYMVAMLAAGW